MPFCNTALSKDNKAGRQERKKKKKVRESSFVLSGLWKPEKIFLETLFTFSSLTSDPVTPPFTHPIPFQPHPSSMTPFSNPLLRRQIQREKTKQVRSQNIKVEEILRIGCSCHPRCCCCCCINTGTYTGTGTSTSRR